MHMLENQSPANTEKVYLITEKDLPLSCPTHTMAVWNSHPRIYLAIDATGHAKCPYCSAEFKLQATEELK